MIQWASEQALKNVYVVSVDTGWSAPGWLERVQSVLDWSKTLGMTPTLLTPTAQFESVIQAKGHFPTQKFQWCASLIKGMPILQWLDDIDPDYTATVMVAHRRDVAPAYFRLPEHIEVSDFYGDRPVWHALYQHTHQDCQNLVEKTPIAWHTARGRALECDPCINSNARDIACVDIRNIKKTAALEASIGQPMFAQDIYQGTPNMVAFRDSAFCPEPQVQQDMSLFTMGCGDPYGCGT